MDRVRLKPWRDGDGEWLDALLDSDPDPIWLAQGHQLHGLDPEPPAWRRTLVAFDGDEPVGAASVAVNWVHATRLMCAVEVAPGHRRRGVGTALYRAVRALTPDGAVRPVSGKVRPGSPAEAFVAALGGRPYQRCECLRVDPSDPAVHRWCAGAQPPTGVRLTPLSRLTPERLSASFVAQWRCAHRDWSPITSVSRLVEVAVDTVAEADSDRSTAAWVDGRLAATVWVFSGDAEVAPAGTAAVELIAETQRADEPDGVRILAAAVARSLSRMPAGHLVGFDGHVTDPHLTPVLASLPSVGTDPLLLVEMR